MRRLSIVSRLGILAGALFVALLPELAWKLYGPRWVQTPVRPTQAYWSGGGDVL